MSISLYDISHIDSILAGEGTWFTAHLLRLMLKSDKGNLRKLGSVYPDTFAAFCKWKYGGVPLEYSTVDSIYKYVTNSNGAYTWIEG